MRTNVNSTALKVQYKVQTYSIAFFYPSYCKYFSFLILLFPNMLVKVRLRCLGAVWGHTPGLIIHYQRTTPDICAANSGSAVFMVSQTTSRLMSK